MAAQGTVGNVGGRLREARERRGISLRQIANATKISVSVLEALERNDISRLPGGIFGRAFVRSYAVEVGVDPEDLIQEFIAQFPQESVTVGHRTAEPVEDGQAIESSRRMAKTFLRLLLVSVPIAGVVIYLGTAGGRAGQGARPAAQVEPATASGPSTAPAPVAGPADGQRLAVAVSVARACWLSAIVDGKPVIDRTVQAGERQTFEVEREVVLTARDAGAVTITLNGAQARPLGKDGEVVTTRLTLANFREYLVAQ